MLLTYYTLRTLANEWDAILRNAVVSETYSQQRDELAIAVQQPDGAASTVVVVTRSAQRLVFRNAGRGRARRNTASLFEAGKGTVVTGVRIAHRDRVLFVDLGDALTIQIVLFGPRPNAWLVDRGAGTVIEGFTASETWAGREPPAPRPAEEVMAFDQFQARWPKGGTTLRALSRAMPLFDNVLAEETLYRAGVETPAADATSPEDQQLLFREARRLEEELSDPHPRIYWRQELAETFSLTHLAHAEALGRRVEAFDTVDQAVRVFSHRVLAQERFEIRYRPLVGRLARRLQRLERSVARMREEIASPSRADTYERYGHLLMAQAIGEPPGRDERTLPDIMGDGSTVTIPLDPALTPLENANRYYDRARRARASARHAEELLAGLERDLRRLQSLKRAIDEATSLHELDATLERHAEELSGLLAGQGEETESEPFRRFPLPGGFEAWVGKNARSNAELTTRHARPYDLWLHARDVPGSHVVVRRHARDAPVPRPTLEAAAGLAAYFSRARTSALVPVQVTERKYVRPLKGGSPGTVRVDREDVLLVAPRAPAENT